MLATLLCGFVDDSNALFARKVVVPGIEYETDISDIVILFACLTGVHYNLENIFVSLYHAKDKGYALGCILPYAQFFAMMYFSSYS